MSIRANTPIAPSPPGGAPPIERRKSSGFVSFSSGKSAGRADVEDFGEEAPEDSARAATSNEISADLILMLSGCERTMSVIAIRAFANQSLIFEDVLEIRSPI